MVEGFGKEKEGLSYHHHGENLKMTGRLRNFKIP